MNKTLRALYLDGATSEIQVTASDIVAFELKFELALDRIEKFAHICYIAWHAEKRVKRTDLDFESWLETIEMVEFSDDEDPKVS
jgi:hypothetical protein